MSGPETPAGQQLARTHPDIEPDSVLDVERQAAGRQAHADRERRQRVLARLRRLLGPAQIGSAIAVMTLDPDAIEALSDQQLRAVLDGFATLPEPDAATLEATRRYLDEIM